MTKIKITLQSILQSTSQDLIIDGQEEKIELEVEQNINKKRYKILICDTSQLRLFSQFSRGALAAP
jgi:hypothetical protein